MLNTLSRIRETSLKSKCVHVCVTTVKYEQKYTFLIRIGRAELLWKRRKKLKPQRTGKHHISCNEPLRGLNYRERSRVVAHGYTTKALTSQISLVRVGLHRYCINLIATSSWLKMAAQVLLYPAPMHWHWHDLNAYKALPTPPPAIYVGRGSLDCKFSKVNVRKYVKLKPWHI